MGTTTSTGLDPAAVVSGVQTAVSQTFTMIAGLLPIALTVFAALWGVKKAIGFFKKASN